MIRRIRTRSRGDEGIALIEAALISPILLVLIFGIFEFGLIYRDWLTASDAAADAARIGAVVGPDEVRRDGDGLVVNADFKVVEAIREATGGIPVDWIERIVVFKAGPSSLGSPDEQLLPACKDGIGGVDGVCNVYFTGSAFRAVQQGDADFFDCDTYSGSPACAWEPTQRDEGPKVTDIDYIGIWIRIERPYVTGLFGDTFTVTASTILRLEPGATD